MMGSSFMCFYFSCLRQGGERLSLHLLSNAGLQVAFYRLFTSLSVEVWSIFMSDKQLQIGNSIKIRKKYTKFLSVKDIKNENLKIKISNTPEKLQRARCYSSLQQNKAWLYYRTVKRLDYLITSTTTPFQLSSNNCYKTLQKILGDMNILRVCDLRCYYDQPWIYKPIKLSLVQRFLVICILLISCSCFQTIS